MTSDRYLHERARSRKAAAAQRRSPGGGGSPGAFLRLRRGRPRREGRPRPRRVRPRRRPLRPDERPDERRRPPALEGRRCSTGSPPRPAMQPSSTSPAAPATSPCACSTRPAAQARGHRARHQRRDARGRPRPGARSRLARRDRLGGRRRQSAAAPRPHASTPIPSPSASATSPRIDRALGEARRVLQARRPVPVPGVLARSSCRCWTRLYDAYSFKVIPPLGRCRGRRRRSYHYLVESIRRFPDQAAFAAHDARGRLRAGPLPQPLGRRRGDPLRLAPVSRDDAAAAMRAGFATRCAPGRRGAPGAPQRAVPPRRCCRCRRRSRRGSAELVADRSAPGRPGERLARALTELGPAFIKLGQSLAVARRPVRRARSRATCRSCRTGCRRSRPRRARHGRGRARAAARRAVRHLRRPAGRGRVDRAGPLRRRRPRAGGRGQGSAARDRPPRFERDLDFLLWLAEQVERFAPGAAPPAPGRHGRGCWPSTTRARWTCGSRPRPRPSSRRTAPTTRASACPRSTGAAPPARRTFERVSGLPLDDRDGPASPPATTPTAILGAGRHSSSSTRCSATASSTPTCTPATCWSMPQATSWRSTSASWAGSTRRRAGTWPRSCWASSPATTGASPTCSSAPASCRRTRTARAFAQACRAIGEPILGLPLNEISIGRLLGQLLTVASSSRWSSSPSSSCCRRRWWWRRAWAALNPDVNIWQLAQPLVEDWIAAQSRARGARSRTAGARAAGDPRPARPTLIALLDAAAGDRRPGRGRAGRASARLGACSPSFPRAGHRARDRPCPPLLKYHYLARKCRHLADHGWRIRQPRVESTCEASASS